MLVGEAGDLGPNAPQEGREPSHFSVDSAPRGPEAVPASLEHLELHVTLPK